MSDHSHYVSEVQGAVEERHSHPDLEREIGARAEERHRHYDLEREDDRLGALLDRWETSLRDLRAELDEVLGRIRDLERLRPTCVICLDATATQQTVNGPACYNCVGEPDEPETDHHPYAHGQDPDPGPEEYDPGPEIDDEGGISEYRYVLPEDYERGQS